MAAMKMLTDHYTDIRQMMRRILDANPNLYSEYEGRGFSKQRFAWDLFHATKYPSNTLYKYLDDANIQTALFRILDEYGPYKPVGKNPVGKKVWTMTARAEFARRMAKYRKKRKNPAKFDRCVKKVKRSLKARHAKGNAYAICTATGARKRGKNPSRARKWSRAETQEEASFILDTLAGKLDLKAFNDRWDVFVRYAKMQAGQAKHSGFDDLADVISAAANRAARKSLRKNPARNPSHGFCVFARKLPNGPRMRWTGLGFSETARPAVFASVAAAREAGSIIYKQFYNQLERSNIRLWAAEKDSQAMP